MHKIISFDVGIKNMAYCIFDVSGNHISIADWNVVNLMESETIKKKCNQQLANKRNTSICGKSAKYEKNYQCYCETHAKKSQFMMPSKSTYPAFLKKQKMGSLHQIAMTYNIDGVAFSEKRQDLIQKILNFFDNRCLKLIENKQGPNAKKESLITISRNIRDKMDQIEKFKGVTDILIENQISPIASRMTTIQGLLTQYFVMRHDPVSPVNIEFISSRNKLKNFVKEPDQVIETKKDKVPNINIENTTIEGFTDNQMNDDIKNIKNIQNKNYKKHKADSILYTRQLMEKNPDFKKWEYVLTTSKKDDLADCFLQGIWYIQEKII